MGSGDLGFQGGREVSGSELWWVGVSSLPYISNIETHILYSGFRRASDNIYSPLLYTFLYFEKCAKVP